MANDTFAAGRGWVITQLILFALLFAAPFLDSGTPPTLLAVPLGLLIGGLGLLVVILAITGLGRNLSIFPRPLPNSQLVQSGIYSIVRHPIYTGVIFAALSWSIVNWSWIALIITVVLSVFFDRKAAHEETMLKQKFPAYIAYKARVKKLIPWVY